MTLPRIFASAAGGLLLTALGCSGDLAAADQPGDGAPGGTGGQGDEDGGGGTGDFGSDGTGGQTGPAGTGSSGDDSPSPEAETCLADCGNGICTLDAESVPYCDCPEGEAAVGLSCLPCAVADGVADTNIDLASLRVVLKIDGADAPASIVEDGYVVLVDRQRGDEAVLGNSHDGPITAAVIPGSYDVHWRHESGGTLVPRNSNAVIGPIAIASNGAITVAPDGPLSLDDDGNLVVALTTVEVSGSFLFNGQAAPIAPVDSGVVRLLDPATGDEVELGETKDLGFSVRMLPGTYEVHYGVVQSVEDAPRNHDALVDTVVIEAGDDGLASVDVDIEVLQLTGDFLLDGGAAPVSPVERGRVALRDPATGDEIDLGFTNTTSFSLPLVPGSYEVVYRYVQGGTMVPRNQAAVVQTIDLAPGQTDHDVDITTTTISGAFTVDGLPPPTDPADVGELSLRSPDSEDEVVLGETIAGAYEAIVVPGQYDIFYRQKTSSGLVPANTNAQLGSVDLSIGEEPGDIDVPFSPVTGDVLLNGGAPPTSEYDDGRIYLRNVSTSDSVLLGSTRLGSISSLVVPGTYDVYYAVESAGAVVPQNSEAYLDSVQVQPNLPLDLPLDIRAGVLSGALTVDGGPPPAGDTNRAAVYLEDIATDDVIHLGEISAGSFAAPLTQGTYVMYYEMLQSSGQVPLNQRAGIACYVFEP